LAPKRQQKKQTKVQKKAFSRKDLVGSVHKEPPWIGCFEDSRQTGLQNGDTVDGSEILHSPVEVGSLTHYLWDFKNIPGGCLGFLPSTVF